jgi:hypothetical protein
MHEGEDAYYRLLSLKSAKTYRIALLIVIVPSQKVEFCSAGHPYPQEFSSANLP